MKYTVQLILDIDEHSYWLPVDRDKADQVVEDHLVNLMEELEGIEVEEMEVYPYA